MKHRLLEEFARSFHGHPYYHRNSSIGNFIASHLFEDLVSLGRSTKLVSCVGAGRCVVNAPNKVVGKKGRRGDGTFGELVPGQRAIKDGAFLVQRGPIATLEIGAEVKIVAKAMGKQLDRVVNDLRGQANTFERQTRTAIRVAIVGVNFSDRYTSYEGEDRPYPSTVPPAKEAPKIIPRIEDEVRERYDELLVLRFKATNSAPYPFVWVDAGETERMYSAALLRLSKLYDERF